MLSAHGVKIAPSTYYAAKSRPPSARSVRDSAVLTEIRRIHADREAGRGLYGVDLKQVEDRCYLIEVNDNPNIDAGNEDMVLKDALYRELMGVFLRRIQERKRVAT